jgi:hypothetical protein
MFVGPEAGLPGGNSGTIQFRDSELPFLDQFRGLPMTLFCTGKHPLGMGAASVWGEVGHKAWITSPELLLPAPLD